LSLGSRRPAADACFDTGVARDVPRAATAAVAAAASPRRSARRLILRDFSKSRRSAQHCRSRTRVTAFLDTYRACMHNSTRCYVTKLSRFVVKSQLRSDDTRATDERAPPYEAPRRPSRLSTGRRRDTGAAPRPNGESALPSLRRF